MKSTRIPERFERIILPPMDIQRLPEELPVSPEGWQVCRFKSFVESPLILIKTDRPGPQGGWRLPCQEWSRFRWGGTLKPRRKRKRLSWLLVPVLLPVAFGLAMVLPAQNTPAKYRDRTQSGHTVHDPARPPFSLPPPPDSYPRTGRHLALLLGDWPSGSLLQDLSITGNRFRIRVKSNDAANFIGWISRRSGLTSLESGPVHVYRENSPLGEELSVSGEFLPEPEIVMKADPSEFGPPLHFWKTLGIPDGHQDLQPDPPDIKTFRNLAVGSGVRITGYDLPLTQDATTKIAIDGSVEELSQFLTLASGTPFWSHIGDIQLTAGNERGELVLNICPAGDIMQGPFTDWQCLGSRTVTMQTVPRQKDPEPFPVKNNHPLPARELPLLGWILTTEGIRKEIWLDPVDGSIKETINQ
jgi:hypothetical protein